MNLRKQKLGCGPFFSLRFPCKQKIKIVKSLIQAMLLFQKSYNWINSKPYLTSRPTQKQNLCLFLSLIYLFLHKKAKMIQLIQEILLITEYCNRISWQPHLTMPILKQSHSFFLSCKFFCMPKVKMIYHLILVLKIKESYNLIGWEHSGPTQHVYASKEICREN